MHTRLSYAFVVAAVAIASQASAQVTFYEDSGFQGQSFTTNRPIGNFERFGFNDRASSVVVAGERWEVCEDVRLSGRCVVLRPGRYPTLAATVGGAVAGAAIGSNAGRDGSGQPAQTRDVQRCTSVPSQAQPDYWDVTYTFRGQEHRIQMVTPPGATVRVNEDGEPRI